ncbi:MULTISPECIES: hypothetical protein [Aphanizomenon]|uniref:hypothetical protein n=1 Tax=Aphanizomenon TaxID=1175 RepID=UPI001363C166|nr:MULTISPECIES: hypothetical protein [Aphanizomenon]QSV72033.1 MAG: hypothetical protein HEQ20_16415 [Aphanizomenon flos-aquae KM1D3_PB]
MMTLIKLGIVLFLFAPLAVAVVMFLGGVVGMNWNFSMVIVSIIYLLVCLQLAFS